MMGNSHPRFCGGLRASSTTKAGDASAYTFRRGEMRFGWSITLLQGPCALISDEE